MNYPAARALVDAHKKHFPLATATQASIQARRLIRAKALLAERGIAATAPGSTFTYHRATGSVL